MESWLPLFPLGQVLFPGGRLPLRIFEQRYLQLIQRCLSADQGFGIVWLEQGAEVERGIPVRLSQVGVYARVCDFGQTADGLLQITVEGGRRFRCLAAAQQDEQKLWHAPIEWLPEMPCQALGDEDAELHGLLQQLKQHPAVAELQLPEPMSQAHLLAQLAMLLPISPVQQQQWLMDGQPARALEELVTELERLSGQ